MDSLRGRVLGAILLLLAMSCAAQGPKGGPTLTRITEPAEHAEGPYWHAGERALYFVDISGKTLHRYDTRTKRDDSLTLDKTVSLVIPVKDQQYKFVVGLGLDLVVLTWDWTSGFTKTVPIVSVEPGRPTNRFNDGKADAKGRVWAGTMGYEDPEKGVAPDQGTLYRVDNNPSVPCTADPMVTPVSISNGIAWTSDNKVMYFADTPTRRIDAFDFDLEQGTLSNRRPVFEFGSIDGFPDGMTIDADGNLWIACWGGSQVIQVNPSSGTLLKQLKFPVERVTSAVFGGDDLATLYVTTMRTGLNETQRQAQPWAGAVWEVTGLGVRGAPSSPAVVNCKCTPTHTHT